MSTNITVKTKFRINGQEYASVEDMPAEVRQAYERALSTMGGGKRDGHFHISGTAGSAPAVSSKIVFNGQEYASADQMPAKTRELYDGLMATLDAERTPGAAPAATQAPWQGVESRLVAQASSMPTPAVRPESPSSRLLIVGAVIAALLLGSLFLGR